MNKEDCLFCKIVTGEIPSIKVYEDGEVLAFLDAFPTNPGHTLVIPKEHHEKLSETPAELAASMMKLVPDLLNAIMKAVEAKDINVAVNNGELAGQKVFHTHIHLIPRFKDDGLDVWHGKPLEDQEAAGELANKIRENL